MSSAGKEDALRSPALVRDAEGIGLPIPDEWPIGDQTPSKGTLMAPTPPHGSPKLRYRLDPSPALRNRQTPRKGEPVVRAPPLNSPAGGDESRPQRASAPAADPLQALAEDRDLPGVLKHQRIDYVLTQLPGDAVLAALPLHAFDNCDHEQPHVEVLMETSGWEPQFAWVCVDPVGQPLRWERGSVTDYSPTENRWTVAMADGARMLSLHRISVCFDCERLSPFLSRLSSAATLRTVVAKWNRYSIYIDSMPPDETALPTEETVRCAIRLALSTPQLDAAYSDSSDLVKALVQEMSVEYGRVMSTIVFDSHVAKNQGDTEAIALLLPPPPAKRVPPAKGVVPTPPHDFDEAYSNFCFSTHLTSPEAVEALHRLRAECGKLSKTAGMLKADTMKSCRVEEFEHMHATAITLFAGTACESWITVIKNHVKSCFKDVGKGWFNLKETDNKVYEFSKLSRLLRLFNFVMNDTLRDVLHDCLHTYCHAIECATSDRVQVRSTNSVEIIQHESASIANTRRHPLFTVDVVLGPVTVKVLKPVKRTATMKPPASPRKQPTDRAQRAKPPGEPKRAGPSLRKLSTTGEAITSPTAEQPRSRVASEEDLLPEPEVEQFMEVTRMAFSFSTQPESFRNVAVTLFDSAIQSVQSLTTAERHVMPDLFWPGNPVLLSVHPAEEWAVALRTRLHDAMTRTCQPLQDLLKTLDQYSEFVNLDVDAYVYKQLHPPNSRVDLEELQRLALYHREQRDTVLSDIPTHVYLGAFNVNMQDIRQTISKRHNDIAGKLLDGLGAHMRSQGSDLLSSYSNMTKELNRSPRNIEDLADLRAYMALVPNTLDKLSDDVSSFNKCFDVFAACHIVLPKEDMLLQWEVVASPKHVLERLAFTENTLQGTQAKLQEGLVQEQSRFTMFITALERDVKELFTYTDLSKASAAAALSTKVRDFLADASTQAEIFNKREQLFGRQITEYSSLDQLQVASEPYCTLWETVSAWQTNYNQWMNDPFLSLDAGAIEKAHSIALKTIAKLVKTFTRMETAAGCLAVSKTVQGQIDEFKQYLPLISSLRSTGMRDRHWEDISAEIKFKLKPDMSTTLAKILRLNALEHLESIRKISERAMREDQIEQSLDKMTRAWDTVILQIDPYRESGTFVLKGFDDLQALLDDHVTVTQQMAFSAFKKPFAERIESWSETLNLVSDVLEEWMKVQRSWLYLQPIFDSPDIQKQLPTEYRRFNTVNNYWRTTMLSAKGQPNAIRFCSNEKLLEKFQESSKFLDLVQKGLTEFLETKRRAFARFYFLSDDELLEILSQSKNPLAVQTHLRKCFEGIRSVDFVQMSHRHGSLSTPYAGVSQPSTVEIVAILSAEDEKLELLQPVVTTGKAVEVWMTELEHAMKAATKAAVYDATIEYPRVDRTVWMQSWHMQCVLTGSQVHWTREVEEELHKGSSAGLTPVLNTCIAQLKDLVGVIRSPLPDVIRGTLSSLAVLDVHARDITKRMVDAGVSNTKHFEWLSQLRFYWSTEQSSSRPDIVDASGVSLDLWAVMLSSNRPYGYEYIGNTPRLVITPLTDKCFMTMMLALQMNLGGAPAGPAGTGKTESVKDLAKSLAKQCVVFNCSDGLDYLAMGKFFKGLAACGAWACFDEFNRIDVEVLSVVAQQIMTLQSGVKLGLPRIDFESTEIRLDPQFAVFVTMNPGYAGRTELPDNLKALFRPVAMMVPDYALIAEIMLFSFGFETGAVCARKLVSTFQLCSELLSSQSHYDYGMRAVKTVITAAGKFRQSNPSDTEETIVLLALRSVNLPKFLAHDVPLFEGILSDLFPGASMPATVYEGLMPALHTAAEKAGLVPESPFLNRCVQLWDTTQVRHGVMVVGPAGTGKSAVIDTLAGAVSTLAETHTKAFSPYMPVLRHVVNPKAVTLGQLYGEFDKHTREWSDGVLSSIVRMASTASFSHASVQSSLLSPRPGMNSATPRVGGHADDDVDAYHWVIMDGPVDPMWIENLNTLLDDNKKLCLVSGEIIVLSPSVEIMFEVDDLSTASPATVSRCGMIYVDVGTVSVSALLSSWLKTLPTMFPPSVRLTLQALFDHYLAPSLAFMRRELNEAVKTTDVNLVQSMCGLLQAFFERYYDQEGRELPKATSIGTLLTHLPALTLFSIAWSIGGTCDAAGRLQFDAFLRELVFKHPDTRQHAFAVSPSSTQPPSGFSTVAPHHRHRHLSASVDLSASLGSSALSPFAGFPFPLPAPDVGTIFDFAFDRKNGGWIPWMRLFETEAASQPKPSGQPLQFSEVIVPNKDAVRYKYLMKMLLMVRRNVLLTGETGTGKSVNISTMLQSEMPETHVPLTLTFSARTSVNQVQDRIDSYLEKRQRGTYGPVAGCTYIVFVDDLNMPEREPFGAQPPLELLRQWCDYNGWFDRKERSFRRVVDCVLLSAMGPPGGGRSPISPRFLRHFNIVNCPPFGDDTVTLIFGTILTAFLTNSGFVSEVVDLSASLVAATIALYNSTTKGLLPTPAKPHYTFNLRDVSKVFQGLLMSDARTIVSNHDALRLWVHECLRVFGDRLINAEDRDWLENQMRDGLLSYFAIGWDDIIDDSRTDANGVTRLLFGDYSVPGSDMRLYEEVDNPRALIPKMEEYLGDYNSESKSPMNLVMFMDAIEHVSRISRVLRQPQGHALLIGVGGSGRQSLTKLATFIADYSLFQISMSKAYGVAEWKEDLRTVLMESALQERTTVFLFNDAQGVVEGAFEDLNSVLNNGDVPNLFAVEDMEQINSVCRRDCIAKRLAPTRINVFAQFLARVRRHLHVAVCMSPYGEQFRSRLRMFPALVSCTTIDWFNEWPDDALQSVAVSVLTSKPSSKRQGRPTSSGDDVSSIAADVGSHLGGVITFLKNAHQSVATASTEYFRTLRRHNYVTPTSYLEALATFQSVYKRRRNELAIMRSRLSNGLSKLHAAFGQVGTLQADLHEMEPRLLSTQKDVEDMMIRIDVDKAAAAETKVIVEKEEAEAQTMASATKAIADDAEKDLSEALPALELAVACLSKLKKADIDEVKSMPNPPAGVKLTMQAACVMFDVKPILKDDPTQLGKKIKDYWAAGYKALLSDPARFLMDLKSYDRDNISEKLIEEIEPFISMPEFEPEVVDRASKACSGICMWVRAMHKYYHVVKMVEPKKRKLVEAQEVLDRTMAELNLAKRKLSDALDRVTGLEEDFLRAQAHREYLTKEVEGCRNRLDSATKLLSGLGGEVDRWLESLRVLEDSVKNLVGDSLIASCTIAYLGPFTPDFRESLVKSWHKALTAFGLPHTDGCTLISTLSDPVELRAWGIAGLPSDTHSIENAIIMANSRRRPVCVDPQGQASRFIKSLGKDTANATNGFDVVRQNDRKFLHNLEMGVRHGKWILIENIPDRLDVSLEPLLMQQTFWHGGSELINVGEHIVPYNDRFKVFLTTRLANPHFTPELCAKVSVLNFSITPEGLLDQMLGVFVVAEMPELEERKTTLTLMNASMKAELLEIESKMLTLLSASEGDILDDTELVETLSHAKTMSQELTRKMKESERTSEELNETRNLYLPVSQRACVLYFSIADLASVDPMYQFSLAWFTSMFVTCIKTSELSDDVSARINALNKLFTLTAYTRVCKSLYERHRLLFSVLITSRILLAEGRLNDSEWRFVVSGQSADLSSAGHKNPDESSITPHAWSRLNSLFCVPSAAELYDTFTSNLKEFQAFTTSDDPQRFEFSQPLQARLSVVTKMCLLRCLRPDKLVTAAQDLVVAELGPEFIDPPPFDLSLAFEDTDVTTPIIFLLSTGSDPTRTLFEFAEEVGMRSKIDVISLGQGQTLSAAKLIENAKLKGHWVLLQNCHLARSWMDELQRIVEGFEVFGTSKDFRLWLTTASTSDFPVTVLQASVKLTSDPPVGLKANMKNVYHQLDDNSLGATSKPVLFRKLMFGLIMFHSVIQERRRFGPLGWNIPYEFNDSDLQISRQQLELFLTDYEEVPYDMMKFMVACINYGGRITDKMDLRSIRVILEDFFCPAVLSGDYSFGGCSIYPTLSVDEDEIDALGGPLACYLKVIDGFPMNTDPQLFGMTHNANIACDEAEGDAMFQTLNSLQPRASAAAGVSRDGVIWDLAIRILERIPPPFDIEAISKRFPTRYEESMNTVLVQECVRFNRLTALVQQSLIDLKKALQGQVLMSSSLETVADALALQKLPAVWESVSFPCLKPLMGWVDEWLARLSFLSQWSSSTTHPTTYWITAFMFPQAFLTATLQNYARRHHVAIDNLSFSTTVCDSIDGLHVVAADGSVVTGLFLEGAAWDASHRVLVKPAPRSLFSPLPALHLVPVPNRSPPTSHTYQCPVYKTLARHGTLSTTGHSTNFILTVELPCAEHGTLLNGIADSPQWIKAGVAAVCALRQ